MIKTFKSLLVVSVLTIAILLKPAPAKAAPLVELILEIVEVIVEAVLEDGLEAAESLSDAADAGANAIESGEKIDKATRGGDGAGGDEKANGKMTSVKTERHFKILTGASDVHPTAATEGITVRHEVLKNADKSAKMLRGKQEVKIPGYSKPCPGVFEFENNNKSPQKGIFMARCESTGAVYKGSLLHDRKKDVVIGLGLTPEGKKFRFEEKL